MCIFFGFIVVIDKCFIGVIIWSFCECREIYLECDKVIVMVSIVIKVCRIWGRNLFVLLRLVVVFVGFVRYSNVDVWWGVGLVKGFENDFVIWGNIFDDSCVDEVYMVEFKDIMK